MRLATWLMFWMGFFAGIWAHESDSVVSQIGRNGILNPIFYKKNFKCVEVVNE